MPVRDIHWQESRRFLDVAAFNSPSFLFLSPLWHKFSGHREWEGRAAQPRSLSFSPGSRQWATACGLLPLQWRTSGLRPSCAGRVRRTCSVVYPTCMLTRRCQIRQSERHVPSFNSASRASFFFSLKYAGVRWFLISMPSCSKIHVQ